MRTLNEKIERFNEAEALVQGGPPNEHTQLLKKHVESIRDLLIKADVAMEKDRSPHRYYDQIDVILDEIDNS